MKIECFTTPKGAKPHFSNEIVRDVAPRTASHIRVNRSIVAPEEFTERFRVTLRRTAHNLSVTFSQAKSFVSSYLVIVRKSRMCPQECDGAIEVVQSTAHNRIELLPKMLTKC